MFSPQTPYNRVFPIKIPPCPKNPKKGGAYGQGSMNPMGMNAGSQPVPPPPAGAPQPPAQGEQNAPVQGENAALPTPGTGSSPENLFLDMLIAHILGQEYGKKTPQSISVNFKITERLWP